MLPLLMGPAPGAHWSGGFSQIPLYNPLKGTVVPQNLYYVYVLERPLMTFILGGIILAILAIPVWKIRQCQKTSLPIWPFLLSREGRPFLLIIVLWIAAITLMSIRVYGAYWTLSIEGQHAKLHYWFPRPDPILQTSDISEIMLIEDVSKTRKGVNRSWIVALRTYTDRLYWSVNLYHPITAQRVLEPLEKWTGLKHTTYRRESFFSSPRRVVQ